MARAKVEAFFTLGKMQAERDREISTGLIERSSETDVLDDSMGGAVPGEELLVKNTEEIVVGKGVGAHNVHDMAGGEDEQATKVNNNVDTGTEAGDLSGMSLDTAKLILHTYVDAAKVSQFGHTNTRGPQLQGDNTEGNLDKPGRVENLKPVLRLKR